VTAPYRMALIHSVPDFDRWFEVMTAERRQIPGVERMAVHRSVDDSNEVMVVLEISSLDVAREMLASEELRGLLDRAGVDFYPPVFIGEQVDELSTE
jgi:hypothetical protein